MDDESRKIVDDDLGSSLSKIERRKLKKLRKIMARGDLSSTTTLASLISSGSSVSAESLLATSTARVDIILQENRDQIKVKELQHLLLWLAQEQMKQPSFASAKNRGLITGIVVVLLKGLTYEQWEAVKKESILKNSTLVDTSTSSQTSTNISEKEMKMIELDKKGLFLSTMTCKRLRHSRLVWNAWQRIVTPMEEALLSLPRNALVVHKEEEVEGKKEGKEKMDQNGKKRKRTKDEEEEEEEEEEEVEE